MEFVIVTGWVVAMVIAGVELVDCQFPVYVPPAVIVIGPLVAAGGAAGTGAGDGDGEGEGVGDGDPLPPRTSQCLGVPTAGSPKTAFEHSTPSVKVRGAVKVALTP